MLAFCSVISSSLIFTNNRRIHSRASPFKSFCRSGDHFQIFFIVRPFRRRRAHLLRPARAKRSASAPGPQPARMQPDASPQISSGDHQFHDRARSRDPHFHAQACFRDQHFHARASPEPHISRFAVAYNIPKCSTGMFVRNLAARARLSQQKHEELPLNPSWY